MFDYESFVLGMVDVYYSLNYCDDFFFFKFKFLIVTESKVVVVVGKKGRRKKWRKQWQQGIGVTGVYKW